MDEAAVPLATVEPQPVSALERPVFDYTQLDGWMGTVDQAMRQMTRTATSVANAGVSAPDPDRLGLQAALGESIRGRPAVE